MFPKSADSSSQSRLLLLPFFFGPFNCSSYTYTFRRATDISLLQLMVHPIDRFETYYCLLVCSTCLSLISVKPVGLFNFSRDKLKTKCIQKENATAKFRIPFSYPHQKQKRTVECTKTLIDDFILANLIHFLLSIAPLSHH